MTGWLCLGLALAFLAFSALAVFRAPTLPLVFLAVGATEMGHWFAVGAFGLASLSPHRTAPGMTAAGLALLAAITLLTPAARAWRNAPKIRAALAPAFGHPAEIFCGRKLFSPFVSHRQTCERLSIEGPGGPVRVDFYRTRADRPAPLVLVVHGGGWMAGGAEEMAAWNPWLAQRGYAVASVEYRLVPAASWPGQREDVLAALDHLRENAARFGLDADRVVLLGRSAGGQIASAIAAPGGRPWLRGCVCLYAPFDLGFAYEFGREDDALRSRWLLRGYLGGTPDEQPAHYREASAYLTASPSAAPFLLLHGGRDELVWKVQSERFSTRLTEIGVRNALVELPWATHAFDYHLHGPGGQALAAGLLAFLRSVCGQIPSRTS